MQCLGQYLVRKNSQDRIRRGGFQAVRISCRNADNAALPITQPENFSLQIRRRMLPIVDFDACKSKIPFDAVKPFSLVSVSVPAADNRRIRMADKITATHSIEMKPIQRTDLSTIILEYLTLDYLDFRHILSLLFRPDVFCLGTRLQPQILADEAEFQQQFLHLRNI